MTTTPHPARSDSPTLLRLRGPADVAAALPHLVGFHPEESLVLVGLSGARTRLRGTVRVDLAALEESLLHPSPGSELTPAAMLSALQRGGVDSVVVAVVCEEHRGDHHVVPVPECPPMRRDIALPHSDVAVEVRGAAESLGIGVQDIILVQGGRFWSYLCGRRCCPAAGTPIRTDARERVAAAFALEGERPLRDRGELAALVAPGPSPRRARVAALRTAAPAAEPSGVDLVLTAARSREPLPPDHSALVLSMLEDVRLRDRLIASAVGADDPAAVLDVATGLLRDADDGSVAAAASVVAAIALATGKGALANLALDRGLAADPEHSLCRLLDGAARAALPPDLVRAVVAEAGRELGD